MVILEAVYCVVKMYGREAFLMFTYVSMSVYEMRRVHSHVYTLNLRHIREKAQLPVSFVGWLVGSVAAKLHQKAVFVVKLSRPAC